MSVRKMWSLRLMKLLYPALACLALSVPVLASDPVAQINGDEISRADVDAFVALYDQVSFLCL